MNSQPVALVTGAYRGLGLETVRQLANKDYKVILTGRKPEKCQAAVDGLAEEGLEVLYHLLDVNDENHISAIANYIESEFGKLDVLVNNAGVHYDQGNKAISPDWKIVEEANQTNFIAPWKLSVALIPLLRKSDQPRIVNVSSGAGSLQDVTPGTPAYSTSKAALNMLTIQLAAELEEDEIKVNAVCPGWVRTEMGGQAAPRSVEEGASGIVWAATLENDGPSGGFYRDGKEINW